MAASPPDANLDRDRAGAGFGDSNARNPEQISALEPDTRFELAAIPELTGRVLSHGSMGCRVRFDRRARQVEIGEGEEKVSFSSPGQPVIISNATMVRRRDAEADRRAAQEPA